MSVDEKILEARLRELQLTAPRNKPADIDAVIKGTTYTVLPSKKVMVCEITLFNGFTVHGFSYAVCPENFNEEIGREVSFKDAREKIWQIAGFMLQQRLYQEALRTA
ncbi:Gp49 family protein [Paraburkholderia sp. BCC1886]|uniref:Gp49 family protein n=1 Tax=Paraburkholderia sp. BCC1886 TaxID=2562670 RepID=UPI0011846869|nr:Gp49 family protein [Paraburkholderia sp. BCC1886]